MAEYIDRERLLKEAKLCDTMLTHEFSGEMCLTISYINSVPAVDVVPMEALKKWLHENALNNAGSSYGATCIEIANRLDGLRRYAKEMENEV